jgi:dihydropteroate synthase
LQAILRKNSLNCAGTLLVLDQPKIMGILNATPDSFYTESRIIDINLAVESAGKMLENGANIIDIGGQSTRPGAETVSSDLEANRVLPIIEAIHNAFPSAILSVDTFYASVARDAAKLGAGIINDVSGGDDPEMFELVGELGLPYVLMHRPGSAKEMQKLAVYEDVILDIGDYFSKKIAALQSFQVKDILIDPGFGFGKTLVQNYKLLAGLNQFKIFELPLMIGVSRKKMIQQVIQKDAQSSLNGTTAVHMAALLSGAKVLRVHDVKEAKECIDIFLAIELQIS